MSWLVPEILQAVDICPVDATDVEVMIARITQRTIEGYRTDHQMRPIVVLATSWVNTLGYRAHFEKRICYAGRNRYVRYRIYPIDRPAVEIQTELL